MPLRVLLDYWGLRDKTQSNALKKVKQKRQGQHKEEEEKREREKR